MAELASSTEALEDECIRPCHRAVENSKLFLAYQVKVVSIRFNDAFDAWSRPKTWKIAGSLVTHFNRSLIPIGWSDLEISRTFSSSENVITQSVRMTTTCSTIMNEVRDLDATCFPSRNSCSCWRDIETSWASRSTFLADSGAPFTLSTKSFSSLDTCTAAVITPINDAETERGSMASERSWWLERQPQSDMFRYI